MKSILMTTSAMVLVTGLAAQAQAACPEDIDAFSREYEQTLQSAEAGQALTTSEQAQLFGLRMAAEKLYASGEADACATVIQRASTMLESAIAPQVIKPSELIGQEVTNAAGEDLGEIEDVMIDPISGRIAYVVLEHGGFLGIGSDFSAVPWRAMTFVPGEQETLLLDIPEERLENAPRFSRDDETPLERREWVTSVHSYYGVEPYWQDDVGALAIQAGATPDAGAAAGGAGASVTTTTVPVTVIREETETEGDTQAAPTEPAAVPPAVPPAVDEEEQVEPTDGAAATIIAPAPAAAPQVEPETAAPGGAQALVEPQPDAPAATAGPDAEPERMSMLMSRFDELEQQVQELSQTDLGAEVRDSIVSLEERVQQLAEQGPGEEVTQAISSLEQRVEQLAEQGPGEEITQAISQLEERVQQLSDQGVGDELRQRLASLEERIATFGDGGVVGGQGAPAAVVIVPDQQADEPAETGQEQAPQATQEQEAATPPAAEQQAAAPEPTEPPAAAAPAAEEPAPAGDAGATVTIIPAVPAPPAGQAAVPGGQPCEKLLAVLQEDLERAEQLGVAINDAESEYEEAQAMLNNNSEALCRAAIRRAHDELVAVGFEPTELN